MVTSVIRDRGKIKDVLSAVKLLAEKYPDKTIADFLTCENCGHTGFDVIRKRVRVYSRLHKVRSYCQDEFACWARWDKANLFPGWSLERN